MLQEIDRPHGNNYPRMAEPVVKRWWQPNRVDQIPRVMAQAFTTMNEGRRGPVLVDIPQDLQAETADYDPSALLSPVPHRAAADPRSIIEAATLLAKAERPVILAGGGVIAAEATAALREVAEFLGAPVTHSFMGKGAFPADHELYAWPCGDMGSISGNALTRTADVILAVGSRFSDRITSSYRPGVTFSIPDTKLVHIDIDGFEIGRNYPAEVGVIGDARTSLESLLTELRKLRKPTDYRATEYFAEIQDLKAQWEEYLRPMRTTDQLPMTNSRAMVEIRKALPRNGILVTDSSNPANQAFNEFPCYEPRSNIVAGGMSGIGFGVPAAIGAQIGAPDRQVLAMVGDGAFLQTGTELAAAVMANVPLVIVVLNNGGWQAIKDLQINLFGREREIVSGWYTASGERYFADIRSLAESLGCSAERVEDPADLADAIERAMAVDGPAVVEVLSANELPWTEMHTTGWWDITVPSYLRRQREGYESNRGF